MITTLACWTTNFKSTTSVIAANNHKVDLICLASVMRMQRQLYAVKYNDAWIIMHSLEEKPLYMLWMKQYPQTHGAESHNHPCLNHQTTRMICNIPNAYITINMPFTEPIILPPPYIENC